LHTDRIKLVGESARLLAAGEASYYITLVDSKRAKIEINAQQERYKNQKNLVRLISKLLP
jgi:histidinol phosphatase-like PHP family hydrolase